MARITIVFSILFIALGVGSYFGTGGVSVTALIPAFFGAVLLVAGLLALKDNLRKHAMHGAAGLALLGIVATVPGVVKFFQWLGGGDIARPDAAKAQAAMCLLTVLYLALSVRSFINARRARQAQAQ